MNLIFINSLPTSVIFGKKIDAWWFHKNGFNVEFWDTSPIYFDQDELERYYGGNKKYKYNNRFN